MTTETFPTYFIAGWSLPGCLPEMDPATFETEAEAREFIADERNRFADDNYENPDAEDHYEYWVHPVTPTTVYEAYQLACDVESCGALDEHMWRVHGCPSGPLG